MASWTAKTTKWRICLNIALKGHHRYETDERTLSHPNSDLLNVVVCLFICNTFSAKESHGGVGFSLLRHVASLIYCTMMQMPISVEFQSDVW